MKQPGTDYRYVVMQSAAAATGNGTAVVSANTENGAYSVLTMQAVFTNTATVTFEGTVDGTNWVAIPATNLTTAASATTATASGLYRCSVAGLLQVRARVSAWTSGTVTVTGMLTVDPVVAGAVALAAGETVIGLVGSSDTLVEVTPVLDTNVYHAGDTLFAAIEVPLVGRTAGGSVVLESVVVIDKADQKPAFNIHFFDRTVTFGTINAAPGISDADIGYHMGYVKIVAGDYLDLGGASIASGVNLSGIGLQMKPNATSLWIGGVVSTTPTFGAATDIVIKLGFLRA